MKKMMHAIVSVLAIILFFQMSTLKTSAQDNIAIKSNLLGWLVGTINLGVELPISDHLSLGLGGSFTPWEYTPTSKQQHLLVRPEVRLYPCQVYRKSFFGIQGLYGAFHAGGLKIPFFPIIKHQRYIGTMRGVSLIGGYQLPLNKHWSVESLVGIGYIRAKGELFELSGCSSLIGPKSTNYIGLTDICLSFIYVMN